MGARIRLVAALVIGLGVLAACGTPQQPDAAQLSVTLTGTGSGAVVSEPAGIDTAAGELTGEFAKGATVTLTATAAAGSSFTGFSGVTCEEGSGDATCVVTIDEDTSVTATFALIPVGPTLTVALAGDGAGTVTSDPTGIDSEGGDLSASFTEGTEITLTATPAAGSAFTGWTGSTCDGSTDATCVVTIDEDISITATFALQQIPGDATLTVAIATGGDGAGSVTSDPAGIDIATAGSTSATYPTGTTVTLTAQVDGGGFAGWTGDTCAGSTELTCVIALDDDTTVTANFNSIEFLSVTTKSNDDDAVEFLSDSLNSATNYPLGWVWANFQRLDLGYDTDHAQTEVGLRFADVGLPAGANVLEAVLSLSGYTDGGTSGDLPLLITGQLSTDAAAFPQDPVGTATPSFGITARRSQWTTASTAWNISGAWTANQAYESPDIASVVREIVALPGWDANGTLALFLSNTDPLNTEARRVWTFFDGSGGIGAGDARLPTLLIEYVALPTP